MVWSAEGCAGPAAAAVRVHAEGLREAVSTDMHRVRPGRAQAAHLPPAALGAVARQEPKPAHTSRHQDPRPLAKRQLSSPLPKGRPSVATTQRTTGRDKGSCSRRAAAAEVGPQQAMKALLRRGRGRRWQVQVFSGHLLGQRRRREEVARPWLPGPGDRHRQGPGVGRRKS